MITETCVINIVEKENKKKKWLGLFSTVDYFFEAIAVGPSGRYIAGRVQLDPRWDYVHRSDPRRPYCWRELTDTGYDKLNFLIRKLYEDGCNQLVVMGFIKDFSAHMGDSILYGSV